MALAFDVSFIKQWKRIQTSNFDVALPLNNFKFISIALN